MGASSAFSPMSRRAVCRRATEPLRKGTLPRAAVRCALEAERREHLAESRFCIVDPTCVLHTLSRERATARQTVSVMISKHAPKLLRGALGAGRARARNAEFRGFFFVNVLRAPAAIWVGCTRPVRHAHGGPTGAICGPGATPPPPYGPHDREPCGRFDLLQHLWEERVELKGKRENEPIANLHGFSFAVTTVCAGWRGGG
jgi:hypothetical protein